jgi:hypothetical protein
MNATNNTLLGSVSGELVSRSRRFRPLRLLNERCISKRAKKI